MTKSTFAYMPARSPPSSFARVISAVKVLLAGSMVGLIEEIRPPSGAVPGSADGMTRVSIAPLRSRNSPYSFSGRGMRMLICSSRTTTRRGVACEAMFPSSMRTFATRPAIGESTRV
jgi:hypothetical protein